MSVKIDDLLPSAKEIQKQAAIKEAEKAQQDSRRLAAAEAEKRALIERLSKPSGLTVPFNVVSLGVWSLSGVRATVGRVMALKIETLSSLTSLAYTVPLLALAAMPLLPRLNSLIDRYPSPKLSI